MLILITGGSGSGKSAYAEKYLTGISKGCDMYYIATMQVFDKEGEAKVERHRRMRSSRGFTTIEQPVEIGAALQAMQPAAGRTALLECMSNLTANEMFSQTAVMDYRTVAEKILQGIGLLKGELTQLVIVTNNVFEDGISYDESTMEYIRALGSVNRRLAVLADQVIEVVAGIPVFIKNGD